jgi:MoaA/NifB/PqqE/SkfB family radical SAM enzyme
MITIETTSACNLDCVMCQHGLEKDKEYGHFPRGLVPRLAQVLPRARVVQLHGSGEPLMNPGFWDMLALTHEGQHVAINSNGMLVNKKNAEALLDSALSEVNFSLDAACEATYRKIRGADFNRVIGNIRHFIAERNRRGKTRPEIFVNMTLMRENIGEAADFISLCKDLGADKAVMWHMNMIPKDQRWRVTRGDWTFDYHRQHLMNHAKLSNQNIRAAIARAKELGVNLVLDETRTLYFGEEPAATSPQALLGNGAAEPAPEAPGPKDCLYPWSWMLIQQNGGVLSCCFGSNQPLGNIQDAPAHEIWNRSDFRRLRKNAAANLIDPACAGGTCKYVQGKPASGPATRSIASSAGRHAKNAYVAAKTAARAMVGDRAWAPMKALFRKTVSAADGLKEKALLAWSRAAEPSGGEKAPLPPFHPAKPLTRPDVILAYRFILRRDPENEDVVEHQLVRCATLGALLDTLVNSEEFRSLQAR